MKKKFALVAVLALLLVTSAFRYQAAGQHWEYRVATFTAEGDGQSTDALNLAGGGGWELVTVETGPRGRTYFFKRPK
jgi:hypothetical protein